MNSSQELRVIEVGLKLLAAYVIVVNVASMLHPLISIGGAALLWIFAREVAGFEHRKPPEPPMAPPGTKSE